jgi:hypothetical protein
LVESILKEKNEKEEIQRQDLKEKMSNLEKLKNQELEVQVSSLKSILNSFKKN